MSDESQTCPKCNSPYGYQDQNFWVCPECAHEWSATIEATAEVKEVEKFLDANTDWRHRKNSKRFKNGRRHFKIRNES